MIKCDHVTCYACPNKEAEDLRAQLAAEKARAEKAEAETEEAVRRAESAELGCDIAYRREPTQEEGDAHEDKQHQSRPDLPTGECFVAMGGWTGRRCRHCARWVWGGPTACVVCVERASRDELGIQLAACQERLRLAMDAVRKLRAFRDSIAFNADGTRIRVINSIDICAMWDESAAACAALDAVPGDALATSTKKDGE